MSIENMIIFLNILKPLIGRAVFSTILVPDFNRELFIECGQFFQGFRIKKFEIEQDKFENIDM